VVGDGYFQTLSFCFTTHAYNRKNLSFACSELFVLTEKTLELYALAPAPRPHKVQLILNVGIN